MDHPHASRPPDASGRPEPPGPVGSAVPRQIGPLLAAGRDADVYALDQHRVLRRYRNGVGVAEEAAVMRHLRAHGYPVPEVHLAEGTDLVLERLRGPTMRAALLGGELAPGAGGELLAALHSRLHTVPPRRQGGPDSRMLHLDLHPDNIMLEPRGPVVIDWRDAAEGPADLDLALSALILAEAAVGSHLPAVYRPAARELLATFLAGAGGDPLAQLDAALARRARNPNLTEPEIARLTDAAAAVRSALHDRL